MRPTRCLIACCLLLLPLLCPPGAGAEPFSLIVCGPGGEQLYEERFFDWGMRLRSVLVERLGHPEANVRLMMQDIEPARAAGITSSSLENIRAHLEEAAARLSGDDVLFVFLIGHGSHQMGVNRFNIDGPDLTSQDLKEMLAAIPAREIVVINAASSSAGFINDLSGDARIVCTATRNVEERNATDFMECFLQGIEDGSADQNRDGRISVLEACQQAAALTAAAYTGRGLLQTEHALIDDNGDGLGTRLPVRETDEFGQLVVRRTGNAEPPPTDGLQAASVYLLDFVFPPEVPRELVEDYLAALDAVEQLKLRRDEMAESDYRAQLQSLLLAAARANREIHRIMSPTEAEEETSTGWEENGNVQDESVIPDTTIPDTTPASSS